MKLNVVGGTRETNAKCSPKLKSSCLMVLKLEGYGEILEVYH